jgi:orotate phosphoribosyltransferase
MEDTASKIAELLLQIKAVKFQPDHPFTWTSGWKSPVYCDNRITLSHPRIRTYIRQELVKLIESRFGRPDLIAAVATAAIAQGVLVAEAMGLPFAYVRSTPKKHGLQNQIEGEVHAGSSAVVIEDLISTGTSSLHAVMALRAARVMVKGIIAVFTYGFNQTSENFRKAGVPVYALSNFETLIRIAREKNYILPEQIDQLLKWRENPSMWDKQPA